MNCIRAPGTQATPYTKSTPQKVDLLEGVHTLKAMRVIHNHRAQVDQGNAHRDVINPGRAIDHATGVFNSLTAG